MTISNSFSTVILTLPILMIITSCSTFSKKECASMSWENQGYSSAYEGKQKDQALQYYMKECGAEYGVQPNPVAFETGYAKGLISYCTTKRGQEVGLNGGEYQNICPTGKDQEFLKTFIPAKMQFMSKQISELEEANSSLKSKNSDLENEISGLKSQINILKNE